MAIAMTTAQERDFEEKGFIVLKNFLAPTELVEFVAQLVVVDLSGRGPDRCRGRCLALWPQGAVQAKGRPIAFTLRGMDEMAPLRRPHCWRVRRHLGVQSAADLRLDFL